MKEGKKIETTYTQLNAGVHQYPVNILAEELFIVFDVNEGESIYYSWMFEFEGIILPLGIDLCVYFEDKADCHMMHTEFKYWGYKEGTLNEFPDDGIEMVNYPVGEVSLTKENYNRRMHFIKDVSLNCLSCGNDKGVYVWRGIPSYGCNRIHF